VSRAIILVGWRAAAAGQAALVAAALFALFVNGTTWIGAWKAALDMATGSLVLIGPVAAGWAALTYAGLSSQGMPEFAASMSRGTRGWLSPALVVWYSGCCATLIAAVIATGAADAAGGKADPRGLWILGEAFAVLAAQVMLGAVLGSVLVGPWAAPIAASAVFALGPLSVLGYLPGVFDTGSVTGSLVGQAWSGRVLGLQSAVAIGLAVIAGCLLAQKVSPTPAWELRFAAIAAAAVTVAGWSMLDSGGHERYAYERSGPDWACRGEQPRVCLDAETTRPLNALAAEMKREAAALIAVGAHVPSVFDQQVPGSTPRAGHGSIIFRDGGELQAAADRQAVALSLATPTACAAFSTATPPLRALRVQIVMADWIAAHGGAGHGVSFGPAEEAWVHADTAEQATWVARTYDDLAACRLSYVRLPY
jgi:hypothetical protein